MVTIRRVQSDDIIPVIALAYDTLPERYHPSIFNQFYESYPQGFLVAYHEQTLIGFIIGLKTTPQAARILMLSVKDLHRKQGIGSALLRQFFKEITHNHVKRVELEVRAINQGALDFYTKQGFIVQEKLSGFYQNGEDAYSMKKEL